MLRLLTEGDQSRTYEATAPDGTRVFLKELVFALIPDTKQLEAFEQEGELLRQLHHPSIPEYVESFRDGEGAGLRLYLVERFVDGHSLLQELESFRYSESEVRSIGCEVLGILEYLHARSPPVLHRDIKPANVLRSSDRHLALVDFGSARDVVSRGPGATQTGTLGYAAPEQLLGDAVESSDVYGLAASLVHLLTRRPPWEMTGGSLALDLKGLEVSAPFKAWLTTALQPTVARRFDSAVAARLELERAGRPVRLRQWRAVSLAMLLACAAIGSYGAFRGYRIASRPRPAGTQEYCPEGGRLNTVGDERRHIEFCSYFKGDKAPKDGVSVTMQGNSVTEIAHYRDDLLEGPLERFGLNGQIAEKGHMAQGHRQGHWFIELEEGDFIDDKKTGVWTTYGDRNQSPRRVLRTAEFNNGLHEGPLVYYRYSGVKERQETYRNDVRDGLSTIWHENGAVQEETQYASGRRNGFSRQFYPDSKKRRTSTFQDDSLIGEDTEYLPDGMVATVRHYGLHGQPQDLFEYSATGALKAEYHWDDRRKLVKRTEWHQNGRPKLVVNERQSPEIGWSVMQYYESGAKKLEAVSNRDDSDAISSFSGDYWEWYETGTPKTKGIYSPNNQKHGEWVSYWDNGKLKSAERYFEGQLEGEYRTYFESGQLHVSGSYSRGQKCRVWVEYTPNGAVLHRQDLGFP
ncbi:MAG TPA: protein kinase [Myxococcales bacterium]